MNLSPNQGSITRITVVLAIFAFAASLRAQQQQPPPPSDTVFPLGGLDNDVNGDAKNELPLFGLNMRYNGSPILGPGQGDIGGGGGVGTNGVSLDTWFPNGGAGGYNPYYFQSDIDLASNESGDAAWDLNNLWNIPKWNPTTTYSTANSAQAVLDNNGNEWICTVDNGTSFDQQPGPGSPYWVQPLWNPPQWQSGTYNSGAQVSYQGTTYTCINDRNTDTPPSANWETGIAYHSDGIINWLPGDLATYGGATWVSTHLDGGVNHQTPGGGSNWWVELVTKTGEPAGSSNLEWQIAKTNDNGTGVYLDYNFFANGPLSGGGSDFLGGNSILYLDFVYSISSANYPLDGQLFDLEATAQFDNDPINPTTLTVDTFVSLNDYNKYLAGGSYGTGTNPETNHWGNDVSKENPNILLFPNKNDPVFPPPQPQKYSVFRIGFDLSQMTDLGLNPVHKWLPQQPSPAFDSTIHITSIHFTLNRTILSNGIFVRGVRLRTRGMDWLLRGKLDAANNLVWGPLSQNPPPNLPLGSNWPPSGYTWPGINSGPNCIFQTIWNGFRTQYGSSYWSHLLGIQVGNESWTNTFRVYAYLNGLWRAWTKAHTPQQKDMYQFLAGGLGPYRSIYEDQSGGVPPPPMQNQTIILRGTPGTDHAFSSGVIMPGDAIPSEVKNHANPSFLEFGLGITGWYPNTTPPSYGSYGNTPIAPTLNVGGDYTTYTTQFQDLAANISANNQAAAENCYPQNQFENAASVWTPVYSYPATFATQLPSGCSSILNISAISSSPDYATLQNNQLVTTTPYHQASPYNVGAQVTATGSNYICIQAVPANSSIQITNTQYWNLTVPAYVQSNGYNVSDKVLSAGSIYICIQAVPASSTVQINNTQYWSLALTPYDPSKAYNVGDEVSTSASDYVCVNAISQNSGIQITNTAFWEPALEHYFNFPYHPPTPPEIREETWDGLTWGAKGILYNPLGNDGAGNIGLCGLHWEGNVNSGFSDVANGDFITNPPSGLSIPTWQPNTSYSDGQWVKDGGNNFSFCFHANSGNTGTEPSSQYWESSYTYSEITFSGPPWNGFVTVTGVPGYYGMKDRSDGVKRSTADIAPIAWELKNLQWVTSYNYAEFDNTSPTPWASGSIMDGNHPTGDPEFPFEVKSEHVYDPARAQTSNPDPNTYHFGGYAPLWQGTNAYAVGAWVKDAGGAFWRCVTAVPTNSPAPSSSNLSWASNGTGEFKFQTNGETDDNSTTTDSLFYNIGVFHDPNDLDAIYTTIANRRTWPLLLDWTTSDLDVNGNPASFRILDSSDHTTPLLGAIDARRIDLELKHGSTDTWDGLSESFVPWTSSNSGVSWYTITNMRTGWDTTGSTNPANLSTFSLDLEPGEGTLLRVAPATAINLGRTNYMGMGYNNGHRVAEVHVNGIIPGECPPIATSRAVCWESNGSIQFWLAPQPGLQGGEFPPPTSPITIYSPTDNTHWGHNPSIACKPGVNGAPDTLGIVFSVDDYLTRQGARSIQFYWVTADKANEPNQWQQFLDQNSNPVAPIYPATIPYNTSGVPDVTGIGTDGQYSDLLVPTISPANNGFVGAYTKSQTSSGPSVGTPFWIHVSTSGGAHWVVTTYNTTPQLPLPPFQALSGGNVRFATVATNDDPSNRTGNSEIFHFAWESDLSDGSSNIYYQAIEHTWPGDAFPLVGPVTPVSDGYPDLTPFVIGISPLRTYPLYFPDPKCAHRHPMIAIIQPARVGGSGMPAVTWEATNQEAFMTQGSGGSGSIGVEYVTGTTKPIERDAWSFNSSSLTPTWNSFFTVNALEIGNLPQPVLRYENNVCSGVTSNNLRELVFQDTFGREAFVYRKNEPQNKVSSWTANRLEDYAETPSLSLPYEPEPSADLGSISYREIYPDQKNLYAAMLVANPPAEESVNKSLIQYLAINNYNNPSCGLAAVSIGIGIRSGPGCNPCDGVNGGSPSGGGQNPTGSSIASWNFQPVGLFSPVTMGGSTELVQASWPITEDSIRTSYFVATALDTISMSRMLVVDTSQITALLPDATHYILYKLVVKDSASQIATQVLDSAMIRGGMLGGGTSYPGINPSDTSMMGMGYNINAIILPTPSGSAYVTAIITKDNSTQAELIQDEEYVDSATFQVPIIDSSSDSGGGGGYKKLAPHPLSIGDTTQLVVTVHPNPVSGTVQICVEDVPGGAPVMVDVVNQLGGSIATLYNATPEGEIGLCLSLDCSKLPSGIYYADLQTEGMHHAVKFTVAH